MVSARACGPTLLALCLMTCGSGAPTDTSASEALVNPTSDGLHLTAHVSVADPGKLVLDYRVDNRGSADVYLLNRIPRRGRGLTLDPNNIYVRFADRSVHLEKLIPAIPPGRSPYQLVAPYVTPLRAGGTFSERVELALPLRRFQEYHDNMDRPGAAVEIYPRIVFSLGYMVKLPGTSEREAEVEGVPVLLFTNPPGALSRAGVLRTEVGELAIPVLP